MIKRLILILLLASSAAFAQYSPLLNPHPMFQAQDGTPLAGGSVYFYVAGTTTPQNTYTDGTGGTANANPIVLDSAGYPPQGIYFTNGLAYKIVVKDAAGVTQYSVDNLTTLVSLDATGGLTLKKLNQIRFSNQYTAGTVLASSTAPGISSASTGGTVAANTYACEVTFNGSTGETTATPASVTNTTSGATSVLYCQPLDSPMGAKSYNVYWQTGGAGSYWKGNSNVSLAATDTQSTTPVTSGSNPPVSNTAVSTLAAAFSDLGGAGAVLIPSNETDTGKVGNLSANQLALDLRSGTMAAQAQVSSFPIQKSFTSAPTGTGWSLDVLAPTQLATGDYNGLQVYTHAEDSPSYWGGINSPVGAFLISGAFGVTRSGTRTENIDALNPVANCNNNLGICFGEEINLNYYGTPTDSENGGVGLRVSAGGSQRAFEGIQLKGIGSGTFKNGITLYAGSFNQAGLAIGTGGSYGIDSNNIVRAHGPDGASLFVHDTDAAGVTIYDRWYDNGVPKWTIAKTGGSDLQWYDEANSGFTRLNFVAGTNGNTILAAPGTGIVEATTNGGTAYPVFVASLTTTAATSDNVTVTGMTASGHCSLTATNASAATNIATTYISAKAANQITVTHTATASMTYDVLCTTN